MPAWMAAHARTPLPLPHTQQGRATVEMNFKFADARENNSTGGKMTIVLDGYNAPVRYAAQLSTARATLRPAPTSMPAPVAVLHAVCCCPPRCVLLSSTLCVAVLHAVQRRRLCGSGEARLLRRDGDPARGWLCGADGQARRRRECCGLAAAQHACLLSLRRPAWLRREARTAVGWWCRRAGPGGSAGARGQKVR